jgi:uncharacterized protein (DUF2252 family)
MAQRRKTIPIETVQPDDRAAALRTMRNLKMARSSHAYVRGSTEQFYDWLKASSDKAPQGPPVWICGDCHVGNLGPLADSQGRVAVQIRDLDQTVIGNPAHDLIRLGLSLASAARGSDLPTARMMESLVHGYAAALDGDFDQVELNQPDSVLETLSEATRRRWRHLAAERLETKKAALPLGKRFWPLEPAERRGLELLFADRDIRHMVTSLRGRDDDAPFELVDAAYWAKGCSSLGRLRYAVMVRLGEGDQSLLSIIDVKEAVKAAAPRAEGVPMPRDNAIRVMTGAQALSPYLGNRMLAARLFDKAVVLRELMPQDLKIEISQLAPGEANAMAAYLAGVVGRAHGRQMDLATRRGWRAQLTPASESSVNAPSWLWRSVVELLAAHEAAYLDHCHGQARLLTQALN